MRLHWHRSRHTPRADEGRTARRSSSSGFPLTALPTGSADHFLMMAEPGCCQGCVPANPLAVVEVFADQPLKLGTGPLRLERHLAGRRPIPTAGATSCTAPR